MKRGIIFLVFILLINNIYAVTAISSDLKASYDRGETMIGEISGEILENIKPEQVEFKRNHIAVPVKYDIKKIADKYYIWAIAPINQNNYSLVINRVSTMVNGKVEQIDFVHNFSVSGNLTDYSVEPGFILTKDDFNIAVQLNDDLEKSIDIDFPEQRSFMLKPGKNIIKFSISGIKESEFRRINVGKYSMPAYLIYSYKNETVNNQTIGMKFRTEPNAIVSTIFVEEKIIYPFNIINFGDEKIENIILTYNKELFSLSEENISLESQEVKEINLSIVAQINADLKKTGINEKIRVVSGSNILELPIVIRFTENKNESNTPYLNGGKSYYCSELKGIVCLAGEKCDGNIEGSIDGNCCVGKCSIEKKGLSWISYLISFFIILIIIYLFVKYKKAKPDKSFAKGLSMAEGKMNRSP